MIISLQLLGACVLNFFLFLINNNMYLSVITVLMVKGTSMAFQSIMFKKELFFI